MHLTRRRIGLGIVAVAVAALIGGASVLVYEGRPAVFVSLPAASATPAQVLRVYLRAATAHDCATTEALTLHRADRGAAWCGYSSAPFWDEHPDLVSYEHVGTAEHYAADAGGGVAEDCIPVDITVKNMSGSEDGPLPGWEFCFAKTSAGWRLADQGYG